MTGLILIFPWDDRPTRLYKATKHPSLARLHKIVGGYIERVPLWDRQGNAPATAYCNEEGKMHDLPLNVRATFMWYAAAGRLLDDVLVGNVVVLINLPDLE